MPGTANLAARRSFDHNSNQSRGVALAVERVFLGAPAMRFLFAVTVVLAVAAIAQAGELTVNQRLIVAAHRLDVEGVVAALRDGADVKARFGDGDPKVFQDPWSLGWPMAGNAWTPLMAVANSSTYPDPPRKIQNTAEDLNWGPGAAEKGPRKPGRTEAPRQLDHSFRSALAQGRTGCGRRTWGNGSLRRD